MRHDIINEDYLDRQVARARLHHLALTDRPDAEPNRRVLGDEPNPSVIDVDEAVRVTPAVSKRGRRRTERATPVTDRTEQSSNRR